MVPSYNNGRFIFMFDPGTRKFFKIYDTKYEKPYSVNHHAFSTVFDVAIESLNNAQLDELKKKLENEPKYRDIISKTLDRRNGAATESSK